MPESDLPSLAVEVSSELARHIDDTEPTTVVPDVKDVVLDPEIVRPGFRNLVTRDFLRFAPIVPFDHVNPPRGTARGSPWTIVPGIRKRLVAGEGIELSG